MNGHETREAQEAEPVGPSPGRPRRGRVAGVAGSVLLAGALVAGVVYTVVTVRGADRVAGAPTWKFPKVKVEEKKPTARPGLSDMLVPYGGDRWVQGPDIGEFGSDAQLGKAQATALRKKSVSGLPRTQRKQLEKLIDRQRIKGMAMRSYVSQGSQGWKDLCTVSIVLAQMENRAMVRASSTAQNRFLGAQDTVRKGPRSKAMTMPGASGFPGPTGTVSPWRSAPATWETYWSTPRRTVRIRSTSRASRSC
ncbi:hypothetical protein AB0945_22210 [Streptomyces sp. NPDC005474]|uniref:hypothetical protein n=1 Tax=Streptomyces sp. NPDC005474 TaxID=3154878 RepID=UPI003456AB56